MSVIGRLDEQVDEIIIKPLSARNKPESEKPQASSQETAPQPQAGAEEDRAQDEEKSEAHASRLPVWLL